jgi:hypothetical protein
LWEEHQVAVATDTEEAYAEFARQLERQFRASSFYQQLAQRLDNLHANYKVAKGTGLLANAPAAVVLNVKSWPSFFEKSYRKNVRDNRTWPKSPAEGWVLPPSWYQSIGDIVRTITIVRYLDGLEVVAKGLEDLASEVGLASRVGRISKADGYYATHVDINFSPRVPLGVDVVNVPSRVEIQITTELQANIRDLAHGQYERSRVGLVVDPSAWQWEYQGPEFATNYLGHVLHYLEGMIMRLREGSDE